MGTKEIEYGIVNFKDDQETKDKIFNYLMEHYYFKYESFNGESIMQNDDPIIYAPEVLAHIADKIIKFKVKDKE